MLRHIAATREGVVVRDGVRVHYQAFGRGTRTVLLLPTWSVVHSDFWARQVPHLSERYTVVTFDGRGNGASDRPTDPAAYSDWQFSADALAVLDAQSIEQAAVVSLSGGAPVGLLVATGAPERIPAAVFIAPGLSLTPPFPERAAAAALFDQPQPRYDGWLKFNRHYWEMDWQGFLEFFSAECFSEPDSDDDIRHWVEMGLETSPDVILATAEADGLDADEERRLVSSLTMPILVIHGSDDRVIPVARSKELARLTGGELVVIPGAGHEPQYRHAATVNALLDAFLDRHFPPLPAGR